MFAKFKQQGYPTYFSLGLMIFALLCLATGWLLIPLLLTFKLEFDLAWYPRGALRNWGTALHVLTGFGLLFLTGAIWSIHARAGWLRKIRHVSGTLLLTGVISMALSAPIMLYASSEALGTVAAATHTAIGLGLPLALGIHAWRRRS